MQVTRNMSARSLIVVVVLLVVCCGKNNSKKIVCQMVSLESEDGITGYCCVIFRNTSDISVQKEEIKQQILENLKNATVDDISNRSSDKNIEEDRVNFPTDPTDPSEIKFPDDIDDETLKNITSFDQKKSDNSTITGEDKNTNKTTNDTITVIPVNRNAVDAPVTCTEGNERDHNGDCVPVY